MDDATIILRLGGATAVAQRGGWSRSRVSNWPARGIPADCRGRILELAREDGLPLDEAAFMRPVLELMEPFVRDLQRAGVI